VIVISYVHKLHHEGLKLHEIVTALSEVEIIRNAETVQSDLSRYNCLGCPSEKASL
jgi:hypothetical protein